MVVWFWNATTKDFYKTMKKKSLSYEIWTGPMDVDWLVAEIRYDGEHVATLKEWGEVLEFHPVMKDGFISLPTDRFIELLKEAREHLRKQGQ